MSGNTAGTWSLRYGAAEPASPPEVASTSGSFEFFVSHRSVRRYSDRPIPEETISWLVAAAQSAATSSNLQTWSLVSVQDPERRRKIAECCGGQKQVLKAPWFFAFLMDLNRIAEVNPDAVPTGLGTTEMYTTAVIDAALAAERMVVAAESLGLGICYIGALRNRPAEVKELLRLPERTFGVFGLCLGWPAESDTSTIKPRLPQSVIWHRETYQYGRHEISDYDQQMVAFFESQGMPSGESWSEKSRSRCEIENLSGRESILDFLQKQRLCLDSGQD